MAEIDFLCLAQSRKNGGRCIAGIDLSTRQWVRPVDTASETGELPLSALTTNGHVLQPLDRVTIRTKPLDAPWYQPENVGFDGLAGDVKAFTADERKELFTSLASRNEKFVEYRWSPNNDRIRADIFTKPLGIRSLALIEATSATFDLVASRCKFDARGRTMDLSVTDDSTGFAAIVAEGSTDRWYLTISLGEEFHGYHYKLVAACFPVSK